MNPKLRKLFLVPEVPTVIEESVDPKEVLLDFDRQDVAVLAEAYRRRGLAYATIPLDPEGHKLRLFPGGFTIWSGFPGHGKTTLLRQLACHLLSRPSGVFFASLEEDPGDLLCRLTESAVGHEDPSPADLEWMLFAFGDRLKLWSAVGIANYQRLLALIRILARQGLRHAVIDSLMCLDIDSRDFDAQRRFAAAVTSTARLTGCHIHLVAHPRKPQAGSQEADLNDVAGSADLGRLADNVLFVRRGEEVNPGGARPMVVQVAKQRHGSGWTGTLQGWFHRPTRQFRTDQFVDGPIRYLPAEAYAS